MMNTTSMTERQKGIAARIYLVAMFIIAGGVSLSAMTAFGNPDLLPFAQAVFFERLETGDAGPLSWLFGSVACFMVYAGLFVILANLWMYAAAHHVGMRVQTVSCGFAMGMMIFPREPDGAVDEDK